MIDLSVNACLGRRISLIGVRALQLLARSLPGTHRTSVGRSTSALTQATLNGCIIGVCWLLCLSSLNASDIVIDGQFDDWKQPAERRNDAQGDASAAFDLTFVEVVSGGTELYLHFDIGESLNLQSGQRSDGTLQLKVEINSERTLTIDFRERNAYLDDQTDERIVWTSLRMVSQPTYAADEVEMRIDLAAVGAKVGDDIRVQFAGSDSLDEPISLQLAGRAFKPEQSLERRNESGFRVASFNTMNQGLSDESRQPKFRRLLTAVKADVICFQEERDQGRFDAGVSKSLPHLDTGKWATHWANGAAIASPHALRPLPLEMTAGAAAAVLLDDKPAWIVLSIHLKCCGYAGSPEDDLRVTQAKEIVQQLERIREGEFGEEFIEIPVIIVGDYNLVGSREPLQTLSEAGFVDHPLLGLHDASTLTWRGRPDESFWPGRLDLVTYQQDRAKPQGGFTINSAQLTDKQRQTWDIENDDSSASDHLMIVIDFAGIEQQMEVNRK